MVKHSKRKGRIHPKKRGFTRAARTVISDMVQELHMPHMKGGGVGDLEKQLADYNAAQSRAKAEAKAEAEAKAKAAQDCAPFVEKANAFDAPIEYSTNPLFWDHPIFNTDSYKVSMSIQYPPNTKLVYSYIEARAKGMYTHTVFFGLTIFIKRYLMRPITEEQIREAYKVWNQHLVPFTPEKPKDVVTSEKPQDLITPVTPEQLFTTYTDETEITDDVLNKTLLGKWLYILRKYNGYLPLLIRAPEEGTVVPIGLPLVSIENTDPYCYWLTTWLETSLLRAVWYPTTVATQSKSIKNVFKGIYEKCGILGNEFEKDIKHGLHDFGARGVSSYESAGIGAAAHLVNFRGTDTFAGALTIKNYYGATIGGGGGPEDYDFLLATSVPASEHSTMTSWGRADIDKDQAVGIDPKILDSNTSKNIMDGMKSFYSGGEAMETILTSLKGEEAAYANFLLQYPQLVASVVSDSYDIYKAVYWFWGKTLKPLVIARNETNEAPEGKPSLVIRPDSGDPLTSMCRLIVLLTLQFEDKIIIGEKIGEDIKQGRATYQNLKDFKEREPNGYIWLERIKLLQGDGVNEQSVTNILRAITKDFSATSPVFASKDRKEKEFKSFEDIVAITDDEAKESRKSPILFGIFGGKHEEGAVNTEKYDENYTNNGNWRDDEMIIYKECFNRRGVTLDSLFSPNHKWDPRNIGFGMGGALLQILNRDTQRWAMKCSSIFRDNNGTYEELSVTKDPITDQGKKSKTGWVELYKNKNSDGFAYAINTESLKKSLKRIGVTKQTNIDSILKKYTGNNKKRTVNYKGNILEEKEADDCNEESFKDFYFLERDTLTPNLLDTLSFSEIRLKANTGCGDCKNTLVSKTYDSNPSNLKISSSQLFIGFNAEPANSSEIQQEQPEIQEEPEIQKEPQKQRQNLTTRITQFMPFGRKTAEKTAEKTAGEQ